MIKLESLPIYGVTLQDLPPQPGSLKWGVWRERIVRNGRLISEAKNHYAIDFGSELTANKVVEGTPVVAVAPGRAVEWGTDNTRGNYVILEHDELVGPGESPRTYRTHYYHLQDSQATITPIKVNGIEYDVRFFNFNAGIIVNGKRSIFLKDGDFYVVTAGTPIGRVGDTGASDGAHLHFELRALPQGRTTQKSTNNQNKNSNSLYQSIDPEPYFRQLKESLPVYILGEFTGPEVFLDVPQASQRISPYISTFESLHPKIQYELTKRKFSMDMIKAYTPFVNLTSLMYVDKADVVDGTEGLTQTAETKRFYSQTFIDGWCPSIGLHSYPATLRVEQLYDPTLRGAAQANGRSIVGIYTRPVNTTGISTEANHSRILGLLARQTQTELEPRTIPYPGITNVSIERSLAGPMGVRGGLFRINMKLMAYSVGQLDTLLKYFLRPGTPLVFEFGRRSSDNTEPLTIFDWNRPLEGRNGIREQLDDILSYRPKTNQTRNESNTGVYEYVYQSYGNYDILIGYAVKFNIKQSKENVFEIDLTMHSIQQFEVPTVQSAVKSNCAVAAEKCSAIDVREYFSPTSSWKEKTFKRLIDTYLQDNVWKKDIIPVVDSTNSAVAGSTGEPSYLVTWRFFVAKILNDRAFGIASLFPEESQNIIQATLINPETVLSPAVRRRNDKLIPNEVGYHPYLRSTNPGTMIILNFVAQDTDESREAYAAVNAIYRTENRVDIPQSPIVRKLGLQSFPFGKNLSEENIDINRPGVGTLLTGVWINTNAIIEAFSKTDTISQGLQALLVAMNSATEGYWNLQLFTSDDSQYPGLHVVDMGLSKKMDISRREDVEARRNPLLTSLTDPLTNKNEILTREFGAGDTPKYMYVFNERSRILEDNQTFGSELLDLSVNLDLPTAIATQVIAGVGGSAEKGTLNTVRIDELDSLRIFKRSPVVQQTCAPSTANFRPCSKSPTEIFTSAKERIEQQYRNTVRNCQLSGPLDTDSRLATVTPERTPESFDNTIYTRDLSTEDINARKNLVPLTRYGVERCIEYAKDTRDRALDRIGINLTNGNGADVARLRETLGAYKDFGSALEYVELNPANMLRQLNLNSRDGEDPTQTTPGVRDVPTAHAFNSSNLTKVLVDLTLPGISGIQLLQSFLVDRIPQMVSKGYYAVTKINHEISADKGWITKIQGRFRYAPDALPPVTPASSSTSGQGAGTTTGTAGTPEWPAPPTSNQSISQTDFVKVIKRFEKDNNLAETGIVGRPLQSNTSKAIQRFQQRYQLSPDGVASRRGETIRTMLELLNQGKTLDVPAQ